jgi:hypothetical protein
MTTKRRFSLVNVLVTVGKVLLISLGLIYLAEYFDLPLFREAGGRVV